MKKFETIEQLNKEKYNHRLEKWFYIAFIGFIIYAFCAFISWELSIVKWGMGTRLVFSILLFLDWLGMTILVAIINSLMDNENKHLFEASKEENSAENLSFQTKSKFQQRLEDLSKERNKPKE